VAAFTVTGLQVKQLEDDQQKEIDAWGYDRDMATFPDDACKEAELVGRDSLTKICDDGEQMAMLTNVFLGVTAVAALATGWFYYKGYIAPGEVKSEKPSSTSAKARKPPRNLTILPTLSPDGAGLTTVIQF
jgi:hypothetical protein